MTTGNSKTGGTIEISIYISANEAAPRIKVVSDGDWSASTNTSRLMM
jgi:hypothetical protein